MGACIVLLTWSREERSERFGDPCDVRMLVPLCDGMTGCSLWKNVFVGGNSPLNDDYVLLRGDAKICFTRE